MTISSSTSRVQYVGNGSTTEFATTFKFLADDQVNVYLDDVLLVLTTDYTIAGAELDAGGTVTFLVAPVTDSSITIIRVVPATQEIDYITGGPFPAETHERGLDKLTMLAQEATEAFSRSMKLAVTDVSGVDTVLPTPTPLTFFQWNETGTALQLVTVNDITTTAVFSNFQSDVFTDTVDYVSGTTTTLTLTANAGIRNNTQVYFDGVYQEKGGYTLTGGTLLTFTAPIPLAVTSVEVSYGTALPQSDIDAQVAVVEAAVIAAELAETNAQTAETNAQNAQTAAELAETNAASSASTAGTAATNAGIAQTAAELAETNAEAAQTAAELAEANAETAQTAAELAETNAEAAQAAAEAIAGSAVTTDNDMSFDLSVTDNFTATPTGTPTLTFTNIVAGKAGNIKIDNAAAAVISAASTTYITAAALALINGTGVHWLSYYSADGTNVLCSVEGSTISGGA